MGILGISKIEYYGNWGGPGHGTEGVAPKDRLDNYYRDHDRGYGSCGYFDAASDVIYSVNALDVLIDRRARRTPSCTPSAPSVSSASRARSRTS